MFEKNFGKRRNIVFFLALQIIIIWADYLWMKKKCQEFHNESPSSSIANVAKVISSSSKVLSSSNLNETLQNNSLVDETTLIIVTPTHKRSARLSQTLMHVKNIKWLIVEDGNETSPIVERILKRSKIEYTYFFIERDPELPRRGWTQRNAALKYMRENFNDYAKNAVVYFADGDNTYDIRLFDNYIRKVKTIGIWAVGLSGAAKVEAPHVINGTIVSWDVQWAPGRLYAVDMAGFGINLKTIMANTANFGVKCKYSSAPETCFLSQFNIPKEMAQPFGYDDNPKEVLVWHTQTNGGLAWGKNHGYEIE